MSDEERKQRREEISARIAQLLQQAHIAQQQAKAALLYHQYLILKFKRLYGDFSQN